MLTTDSLQHFAYDCVLQNIIFMKPVLIESVFDHAITRQSVAHGWVSMLTFLTCVRAIFLFLQELMVCAYNHYIISLPCYRKMYNLRLFLIQKSMYQSSNKCNPICSSFFSACKYLYSFQSAVTTNINNIWYFLISWNWRRK